MQTALIIFIKNPELGKAKTRLAAEVGKVQALRIYEALLTHTREVALSQNEVTKYLYYSEFIDKNDAWSNSDFIKRRQPDGNLGSRMETAFREVFAQHQQVLIVGSDCAQLSPEILTTAFAQLEQYDFVVGPAEDGGYYLLGMQKFTPEVFRDIPWSAENTFTATLQKIEAQRGSCFFLPELSDIDYKADWDKHGWKLPEE